MSDTLVSGEDRRQELFLPKMLDEYVEEDNEVRLIDAFVNSLDMKALGFKHAEPCGGAGRAPYDPRLLLALFIWGYLNGIRSSRKLERECHRNLEVQWLLRKLAPDFKTIADFRKDNVDRIKAVFKEFVKLCMSLDLFGGEFIAIDGVKIKAVNSIDRNFNQETLSNRLKKIDERVSKYIEEMERLDKQEEGAKDFLHEKIKKLRERKEEYSRLLKRLQESKENEVSLTDPDSRLMKNRGRVEPCYNSHVAVDSKNHLIVDYKVNNISSDQNQLSSIAKSAKETLGVEKIEATADRGFFDRIEIKKCVDDGVTPYVPDQRRYTVGLVKKTGIPTPKFYGDKFVYDKSTNTFVCPTGKRLELWYSNTKKDGKRVGIYKTDACFSCPFFLTKCTRNKYGRFIERWEEEQIIEDMRARMKLHPEKIDVRKEIVEHPFGTIKRALNQGYVLVKGLRKVNGEVGFTMLAYNFRRAINILGSSTLIASISPLS